MPSAPSHPFRAILEPAKPWRGLGKGALVGIALHAALLLGLSTLKGQPRHAPYKPRSSLVVTLFDAPQRALPRALGAHGSAPSAAPGPESDNRRSHGPKRLAAHSMSLAKTQREALAKSLPSDAREDQSGAATQKQGRPDVSVGTSASPEPIQAPAATGARAGAVIAGAAGQVGKALASSVGTSNGSGSGSRGEGSGTGNKSGVASGDTEVLPFRDGMTRPALLSKVDPLYTREAREANVEGLILTKCVISTLGTLKSCRIVKGIPLMDQAVLSALAQWRYSPVLYQGKAVTVEYVIPVRLVRP
jgi:protein TonB